MTEFIQNLIGNDFWATIIMSFFPLVELKGGIIFARSAGFNFFEALSLAYIGSTLVFIPIFFLLKPILNLMKKIKWFNKLALKVEGYFDEKAKDALAKQMQKNGDNEDNNKSINALKQIGVFIFVAIPLPMTGIWTGTAIAVFLGLKFKDTILPVILGNLVAGLIISGLAQLCLIIWEIETAKKVLDYILYGLFALAIILLAIVIAKIASKKTDQQEKGE